MSLYLMAALAVSAGYVAGRWHIQQQLAGTMVEAVRLRHAIESIPGICRRYADEAAAQDKNHDVPEACKHEPWMRDVECACLALGASDCEQLVQRFVEGVLGKAQP